jgi:hypothetical protein
MVPYDREHNVVFEDTLQQLWGLIAIRLRPLFVHINHIDGVLDLLIHCKRVSYLSLTNQCIAFHIMEDYLYGSLMMYFPKFLHIGTFIFKCVSTGLYYLVKHLIIHRIDRIIPKEFICRKLQLFIWLALMFWWLFKSILFSSYMGVFLLDVRLASK